MGWLLCSDGFIPAFFFLLLLLPPARKEKLSSVLMVLTRAQEALEMSVTQQTENANKLQATGDRSGRLYVSPSTCGPKRPVDGTSKTGASCETGHWSLDLT